MAKEIFEFELEEARKIRLAAQEAGSEMEMLIAALRDSARAMRRLAYADGIEAKALLN